MRKVTQVDIAKALGVSPTTVGLVVGNTDSELRARLSKETVRRIQEKAAELGYHPHRGAQILRQGRSNLIVLLNFSGYSELASKRAFHVGRLAHEAGYDFQTVDAYWWIGDATRIMEQVLGLRPEGVIVTGALQAPFETGHIVNLVNAGIPVVSMGIEIPGIPWVHYDAKSAIKELTRRAIRQGRKRIGLLVSYQHGMTIQWQVTERAKGFQEVMAEEGQPAPIWREDLQCSFKKSTEFQSVIISDTRKRSFFGAFEQVLSAGREILQNDVLPDAMICSNDAYAMGFISICARRGISVPDDIMVTGFDNLSYGALGTVLPTTVEQPTDALSAKAIDMLRIRMASPARLEEMPERHVMHCEILWRESTDGVPPIPSATAVSET